MESYVAGIFSTREQAVAANAALLQLSRNGAVRVEKASVYTRAADGNLSPEDAQTGGLDLSYLPGGSGQEALDELNEVLPDGVHVLMAHVLETGPSSVDAAIASHGGSVRRRSIDQLEALSYRRFTDAGSL